MTCKDCVHYDACKDMYYGNRDDFDDCDFTLDCIDMGIFKNKANFVEREQGEWIKFTLGDFDFVDRYKCSLCDNIVLPATNHIDNFLYCSHCGAKMKGGADNG